MTTQICLLCRWSSVPPPIPVRKLDDAGRVTECDPIILCRECRRRCPPFHSVQDSDWCGEFEQRSDWETKEFVKKLLTDEIKSMKLGAV